MNSSLFLVRIDAWLTSKLKLDNVSAQLKKPRVNIVKNIVKLNFNFLCFKLPNPSLKPSLNGK